MLCSTGRKSCFGNKQFSPNSPDYDGLFAAGHESESQFGMPRQSDQPRFGILLYQISPRVFVASRLRDVAGKMTKRTIIIRFWCTVYRSVGIFNFVHNNSGRSWQTKWVVFSLHLLNLLSDSF